MCTRRVLFSALALFVLLTGCNLKAKRAKAYHDNMLHTVRVVIDSSLEYGDAVESHEKDRALRAQQQFSSLVDKTIAGVNAAGNFEGDTTLQHYSLEVLGFYRTSLDRDFAPFLNKVQGNSYTEEESNTADSIYTLLTTTQNNYWERFNWAEKKFSKDHELGKLEK
jgi:hypothetical protein